MIKVKYVYLLIVLFLIQSSLAAFDSPLQFLMRNSKSNIKNPPILILLHGYGSNESDLFSFADQLPAKYIIFSVRAPIYLSAHSYAWYHLNYSDGKKEFNKLEEREAQMLIFHFIKFVKNKYHLEKSEVSLCGFSQGAILSYSLGLTKPKMINGIAVMSGHILDHLRSEMADRAKLQKLRIFISHGITDDIIPVKLARDSNLFLRSIGLHPIYHEYNDVHTINAEMFRDLKKFLE